MNKPKVTLGFSLVVLALIGTIPAAISQVPITCAISSNGISRNPATAKVRIEFSAPVKGFGTKNLLVVNGIVNDFTGAGGEDSPSTTFTFNLDGKFGKTDATVNASVSVNPGLAPVMGIGCGPIIFPLSRTTSVSPTTVPSITPTVRPTIAATSSSTPLPTPTVRVATPTVVPTSTATTRPSTPTAVPTAAATATSVPTGTPIPGCQSSGTAQPSTLKVFPGAEGFGTTTVAGSGRQSSPPCARIYRVTNLNDNGPGSLRECAEASGPRTCIFEVSGLIWATKEIKVTQPFLTIAGQTAPSPGIAVRGSGLSIQASDVLVQHLRLRVGDDPRDPCCKAGTCSAAVAQFCTADPGSRDGLRILAATAAISNVVVDHVSISWALDEAASWVPDKGDVSNVTFSNSIIGSGLDMSIHPEASIVTDPGHSKGVLMNGTKAVRNLSFHKNLLAHNADRNIRISTPVTMEYINNLVYDWGRGRGAGRTIELTNSSMAQHFIDMIGNLYIPGPDTFCPETQYRPELCFEKNDGIDTTAERGKLHYLLRVGNGISSGLNAASRYFLFDNFGPTRSTADLDEWAAADQTFYTAGRAALIYPQNRAADRVASSRSVSELPSGAVYQHVLLNAGARPLDRDSVDVNIVSDVTTQSGRIINCVFPDGSARCAKNAGGWPTYPLNRRTLVVPSNPYGDDDGDGYTNLENWIFTFSRGLESQ